MIVVKLQGGLGNQLFQYAFAKHLSILNGTKIILDSSSFQENTDRDYALSLFEIDARVSSESLVTRARLNHQPSTSFLKRILRKNMLLIKQPDFDYSFNPELLKVYADNVYLDGYWQSEKYFKAISPVIKKDFGLDQFKNIVDNSILASIKNEESVSVHVRRGDYISNEISNEFHNTCSNEYYASSFDYMKARLKNPRFFIFSDDIEWCKQNLNAPDGSCFVTSDDDQGMYKDFFMMMKCSHHIIANSSYSWWSAWLGNDNVRDCIIIAPRDWFNQNSRWYKEYSISERDIIPQNWIKL